MPCPCFARRKSDEWRKVDYALVILFFIGFVPGLFLAIRALVITAGRAPAFDSEPLWLTWLIPMLFGLLMLPLTIVRLSRCLWLACHPV